MAMGIMLLIIASVMTRSPGSYEISFSGLITLKARIIRKGRN